MVICAANSMLGSSWICHHKQNQLPLNDNKSFIESMCVVLDGVYQQNRHVGIVRRIMNDSAEIGISHRD